MPDRLPPVSPTGGLPGGIGADGLGVARGPTRVPWPMKINPRYDGPAVLRFEPAPKDPAVPMLRQRRRLAALLATFDEGQWAAPSRCGGWASRDVVSHLITVNSFWTASITAGRSGVPTRYLAGFDPVATPAQMVESAPAATTPEWPRGRNRRGSGLAHPSVRP